MENIDRFKQLHDELTTFCSDTLFRIKTLCEGNNVENHEYHFLELKGTLIEEQIEKKLFPFELLQPKVKTYKERLTKNLKEYEDRVQHINLFKDLVIRAESSVSLTIKNTPSYELFISICNVNINIIKTGREYQFKKEYEVSFQLYQELVGIDAKIKQKLSAEIEMMLQKVRGNKEFEEKFNQEKIKLEELKLSDVTSLRKSLQNMITSYTEESNKMDIDAFKNEILPQKTARIKTVLSFLESNSKLNSEIMNL